MKKKNQNRNKGKYNRTQSEKLAREYKITWEIQAIDKLNENMKSIKLELKNIFKRMKWQTFKSIVVDPKNQLVKERESQSKLKFLPWGTSIRYNNCGCREKRQK